MSTAPRIDELRRKFDENPRRYFAPLANEYRKAGDLAQAIALCREHLPKQPGHMSGHIVFGQALFENGELAEARTVFESAVALDPENLIALRQLGDIAMQMNDHPAARRWYERVYDADPRNDDIAAQLAALSTGMTPTSVPAIDPRFAPPSIGGPSVRVATSTGDVPAFSMPPLPTPDSSMRAVDFDSVNQQIARFTPLDLDAMDAPAPTPAPEEVTSAADVVDDASASPTPDAGSPEEVDAPSDEAPRAEHAGATEHTADAEPQSDGEISDYGLATLADPTGIDAYMGVPEFEYPGTISLDSPQTEAHSQAETEAATEAESEPVETNEWEPAEAERVAEQSPADAYAADATSFDETEIDEPVAESGDSMESRSADAPVAEASLPDSSVVSASAADEAPSAHDDGFEEGLIAPEWPDTSAIVARLATPRAGTPVSPVEAVPEIAEDAPHAEAAGAAEPSPALEVEAGWAFGRESHETEIVTPPIEIPVSLEGEEEISFDGTAPSDEGVATVDAEAPWESATDEPDEAPTAEVQLDEPSVVSFADVLPEELVEESESEEAAAPQPPAFVTETMGELLVSQGFIERAVTVYEELVRRRPYDPVLSSRLEELRERLAPALEAAAPAQEESAHAELASDDASAVGNEFQMEMRSSDATWADPGVSSITGTPAFGASRVTPAFSTPAYFTPVQGTPVFVTPIDAEQEPAEPVPTARELFMRLAARRVPRRTPPRAQPAVVEAPDQSLSSLFGGASGSQDDLAARTLADAFAPISAQELESGQALDTDFARAFAAPAEPQSFTPPAPAAPVTRGPAFSFDRFFPDPASGAVSSTKESTPAASTEGIARNESPAAPVDDLAEFSAWLKGLGKS